MKKVFTLVILPLAILFLGYMIFSSIQEPVKFKKEKEHRESVAIERLKDIRTLQEAYKSKYGRFTGSFDTLINFYKNDSITIVKQIGSFDDSLAVAQKKVFRIEVKYSVKDTLLRDSKQFIDSLKYIPYSGGDTMLLEAAVRKVSGVDVPLFQASAPFNLLLKGLDRQLIINLNVEREDTGRYPGLKVGDVDSPNNNVGNWE